MAKGNGQTLLMALLPKSWQERSDAAFLKLRGKLLAQIDAKRGEVVKAMQAFGIAQAKVSAYAKDVMDIFRAMNAEEAISFVAFCRLWDPSIPTHPKDRDGVPGYQRNRVYSAFSYIRSVDQRRIREQETGQKTKSTKVEPKTDVLARALAQVFAILPGLRTVVLAGLKEETGWSENRITRLSDRINKTRPFVDVPAVAAPKGLTEHATIIHMETDEHTDEGDVTQRNAKVLEHVKAHPAKASKAPQGQRKIAVNE